MCGRRENGSECVWSRSVVFGEKSSRREEWQIGVQVRCDEGTEKKREKMDQGVMKVGRLVFGPM